MIERLSTLLLGERVTLPATLLPGAMPAGVTLRSGRFVTRLGGLLSRMHHPAAAVTLRRTIVVDPDSQLTPQLLAHELAHVRQWEDDPLFPLRYSLASIRHGYHDNPYEVEARAFASAATSQHPNEVRS